MVESVPVPQRSEIGGTILGAVVTGLNWLAFGFFFAGGWHLMAWLLSKT